MISARDPATWKDLEGAVANLLTKCGLEVALGKAVPLVRGEVDVDVFARDTHSGRNVVIFCECKHWQVAVPKTVVHAFRTVVADGGADSGYIISSQGFQAGATDAAKGSNVRLRTWQSFQADFETLYVENYFRERLQQVVDSLTSFTEPISPGTFLAAGRLPESNIPAFVALQEKYASFALLCLMQAPYMEGIGKRLELPLPEGQAKAVPGIVAGARSYEEFLEAAEIVTAEALPAFRALLIPKP